MHLAERYAQVERTLGKPITGVDIIQFEIPPADVPSTASPGINWLLVTLLPFDVFLVSSPEPHAESSAGARGGGRGGAAVTQTQPYRSVPRAGGL